MLSFINGALKAFSGAAVAGLGALGVALADGVVSPLEWVGVASTTLVAFNAVYWPSNAPKVSTVDGSPYSPDLVTSADSAS